MSAMASIRSPGAAGAAGVLNSASQNEAYGGSTRLKAQATILGSAVGVAMGYAAITSGATIAVVMSGALAIAAAPVAATLSVVYLLQAGTPEQTEAYRNAMDVVGVTSSLGGLVGFTAKAMVGGNHESALEFSNGASLVERLMSVEKVAGLATGYETGSLVFEGGAYVAKLLEEAAPADVPKPQRQQTSPRQTPERNRDQNVDRDTEGQRRAERAQAARERQQERAAEQKTERAEKPGKGETQQRSRDAGGGSDRSTGKTSRDYDRELQEAIRNASKR